MEYQGEEMKNREKRWRKNKKEKWEEKEDEKNRHEGVK